MCAFVSKRARPKAMNVSNFIHDFFLCSVSLSLVRGVCFFLFSSSSLGYKIRSKSAWETVVLRAKKVCALLQGVRRPRRGLLAFFLGNFPWALRRGKACLDVVEPPSLNDFSECRRQRVGIFTEGRRRRRRKTSYLSRLIFPWEVLPGCVSVRAKKGS